ncbi:SDR family NAD(P)-dependent oxidoreductase [Mycolicibacterium sp. BiH015]|uniref:SDR family NAD(P)-dependent oxidoreductase n=1 Tax=Mycolicibacterium sp. BiH015 TaxID=3018808 RepID=UPI0022DF26A1|nr:SDR family NAD(P)-dependent oxidoreductase [Mycolicibacterium sp. BiH015]MDA2890643.1 SDR family NAD(P)-dependent oxidoreductase [Mycolicibacterium sp. BiH015]
MTITLITGGNKGLGYEAARRLIELGHTVYIGARDERRGRDAAQALGARFVHLDVSDDASVAAAAAEMERREGHVDVLINNAGVTDPMLSPEDVTGSAMQSVYDVNVFGIVRVTHAFLPMLRAASSPVIVNVSSGLGSFGVVTNPERFESSFATVIYGSSKAAVGMLTVQYAKALPDFRINVVDPGYTATDINGNSGHQTVTEGTDAILRLATIGPDGPTGTFSDRHGPLPW